MNRVNQLAGFAKFPRNPKFFYFFPYGSKKILSGRVKKYPGQGQKYPGQGQVRLLFTAGQEYA